MLKGSRQFHIHIGRRFLRVYLLRFSVGVAVQLQRSLETSFLPIKCGQEQCIIAKIRHVPPIRAIFIQSAGNFEGQTIELDGLFSICTLSGIRRNTPICCANLAVDVLQLTLIGAAFVFGQSLLQRFYTSPGGTLSLSNEYYVIRYAPTLIATLSQMNRAMATLDELSQKVRRLSKVKPPIPSRVVD
jgi:hypothetical protein